MLSGSNEPHATLGMGEHRGICWRNQYKCGRMIYLWKDGAGTPRDFNFAGLPRRLLALAWNLLGRRCRFAIFIDKKGGEGK